MGSHVLYDTMSLYINKIIVVTSKYRRQNPFSNFFEQGTAHKGIYFKVNF